MAASLTAGANRGEGDARRIAALASNVNGPSATYKSLRGRPGRAVPEHQQRTETLGNVTTLADNAVAGTSAVDTDEEMTNLLSFQRGYAGPQLG